MINKYGQNNAQMINAITHGLVTILLDLMLSVIITVKFDPPESYYLSFLGGFVIALIAYLNYLYCDSIITKK